MNQTPLLAVNFHRRHYNETDYLQVDALRAFLALKTVGRLRELNCELQPQAGTCPITARRQRPTTAHGVTVDHGAWAVGHGML